MLSNWLLELNRTTQVECSIDLSETRRRLLVAEETAGQAALRVVQDMQRITQRAFSSAADGRTRCGCVVVGRSNVTKAQGHCGHVGHSAKLNAPGIPTTAAYLLERLALCRLQRVAAPCGGRRSYFPQLLSSDDNSLSLTTSYEGVPLGVPLAPPGSGRAADAASKVSRWPTYDEIALNARRRGLGSPREQLACAAHQLAAARIVHLDLWCKNVLFRDGALTLVDLDIARVDGRFPPPEVKFNVELTRTPPPRSDRAADWERILTSCLGANRTSTWSSIGGTSTPRNGTSVQD